MALTAITLSRNTSGVSNQIPRCLISSAVAIDTNNALGIALTHADGELPGVCEITADADWFVSNTDGLTAANMKKVAANAPYRFQTSPGKTQNFYMKTATTANVMIEQIQ
jgi:hypothetical protein